MFDFKFNKDNAPALIQVNMDYCASPLWISSSYDIPPYGNTSIDSFDFPNELKHVLRVYQCTWEVIHSSRYIDVDVHDMFIENEDLCDAFNHSLKSMQTVAENMVEKFLKDNQWNTKLCREGDFE